MKVGWMAGCQMIILAPLLIAFCYVSAEHQTPYNKSNPFLTSTPKDINQVIWVPSVNLSNALGLVARIRALSDGNVILAQTTQTSGKVYRFIIGGWANTKTAIRDSYPAPALNKAEKNTPSILSGAEYRDFWVSWNDGLIQLGEGRELKQNITVTWQDPSPVAIGAVGLSTGWDAEGGGQWQVYFTSSHDATVGLTTISPVATRTEYSATITDIISTTITPGSITTAELHGESDSHLYAVDYVLLCYASLILMHT